ncbi:MAG: P13 family porin [Treponema sp.]|jgi:TolB-like protein|nr:P13 family porin [Treponema sp.]
MKKQGILAGFFWIMALTGLANLSAQNSIILDDAIKQSAMEIEGRLTEGIKIVVLNFTSPSVRLSNYIIDELTGAIVNGGKITVVDRQNLSLIQQEMNFQLSGEVSDESAQEIGRKLGAQSIVSGSIEDLGQFYRIRFRVIEVVSAAIQLQPSKNVRKDNQLAALMRDVPPSQTASGRPGAASSTGYPNGLNFSTGRKVGAGFLNMFYGIGSFTMGDVVGGLIVGGTELLGVILFISGGVTVAEFYADYYIDEGVPDGAGVMVAGSLIQLAGAVYGFIRPFSYDTALAKKNGTYYALGSNPLNSISIALVSDKKSAVTANFTYSFSY